MEKNNFIKLALRSHGGKKSVVSHADYGVLSETEFAIFSHISFVYWPLLTEWGFHS